MLADYVMKYIICGRFDIVADMQAVFYPKGQP